MFLLLTDTNSHCRVFTYKSIQKKSIFFLACKEIVEKSQKKYKSIVIITTTSLIVQVDLYTLKSRYIYFEEHYNNLKDELTEEELKILDEYKKDYSYIFNLFAENEKKLELLIITNK